MAVATVHSFRIKPGRLQDVLSVVSEARKIHERLGGRVRVWQPAIGGEAGSVAYVIEHDDMTAYGAFTDKLLSDSEWQALTQRVQGDTNPGTEPLTSTLISELQQ
jgi:hypothetical protein